jgi:hypothetical protein
MPGWYDAYTSVLTKDFYRQYGKYYVGFLVAFFILIFWNLHLNFSNGWTGILYFVFFLFGTSCLGWAIRLIAAFFVRRNGGKPEKGRLNRNKNKSQVAYVNKSGFVIYAFILVLVVIQSLKSLGIISDTIHLYLMIIFPLLFIIWHRFLSDQMIGRSKVKKGSLAESFIIWGNWINWIGLALIILALLVIIWIGYGHKLPWSAR